MEYEDGEMEKEVRIVDCQIEESGNTDLFSMEEMDESYNISLQSGIEEIYLTEQEECTPNPDESIPVIHVVASGQFDVFPRSSLTGVAREEAEKEIVAKLLQEEISYFQVAELLGDYVDEEEDIDADKDLNEEVDVKPEIDHAAEFEKEFTEHRKSRRKGKVGRQKRRRRRKLPDAVLQGLMGEANLRFARREYDEATKMCMEIIRQYPNSSEPYETLGLIYEAKGLLSKSLQFLFIAAFLSSDSVLWEKLAEIFINEKDDIPQAIFCWGRAIRANPENLNFHEERCKLYEKIGDKSRALRGYIHMLKFLQPHQGADALKLAKAIAKIYFEKGDLSLAQEAMETAFKKHPSFVSAEDVNLLLELLMQRELFTQCIDVLIKHMNISLFCEGVPEDVFSALSVSEQVTSATSFNLPPDLPMDLMVKCIISFIRLKNFSVVEASINNLVMHHKEECGDLLFEISEALKKADFNEKAIEVLQEVLRCPAFKVAAVCLLLGECLFNCSRLEEAVLAYQTVTEMAPQLSEPRLVLANILQTLGRSDEALLALNRPGSFDAPIDSVLCYHKCLILHKEKYFEDFILMAQLIFNQHFINIRSQKEAEIIIHLKKISHKIDGIRDLRRARKEPTEDVQAQYTNSEVPLDDQWNLFKKVFDVLYKLKRFGALQRLSIGALGSREFMRDKERANEIEFLCLLSNLYNKQFDLAFTTIREYIFKDLSNMRIWNLFAFIINKDVDIRVSRFLLRLAHKQPDSVPIAIFNGHLSLTCGTYIFSVSEYTHAFKNRPHDPLLPLMLGITYIHMACQKFSCKRNSLLLSGTAFLSTYLKMRGECQESLYNLGRAMHQAGLFAQALSYYRKALECPPFPSDPSDPCLDLSKDIAFHISLIYRRSGNMDMAKMYINKYIRFD